MALAGAALRSPDSYALAAQFVSTADFGDERTRTVWNAIRALAAQKFVHDSRMVADLLDKHGLLARIGGADFLSDCVLAALDPHDAEGVESYARTIQRESSRRQWKSAARQVDALVSEPDFDPELSSAKAMQLFMQIRGGNHHPIVGVDEVLDEIDAQLMVRRAKPSQVIGVPTGFRQMDRRTAGWQNGYVYVFAGTASSGKTTAALSCALASAKLGAQVVIYSMEMRSDTLAARLISFLCGLHTREILTHTVSFADGSWRPLNPSETAQVDDGRAKLRGLPIAFCDDPAPTTTALHLQMVRRVAAYGADLLVVDQLNLMDSADFSKRNENRARELEIISRNLKRTAEELGIPVIELAQLNKTADNVGVEKRPDMSMLRDSGGIAQVADVVKFFVRPDHLNRTNPNWKKNYQVDDYTDKDRIWGDVGEDHYRYQEKTGLLYEP